MVGPSHQIGWPVLVGNPIRFDHFAEAEALELAACQPSNEPYAFSV
jgi:hypothetical protein